MRVLLTGHLGFIGVEMTSYLVDLGHEVVGLDTDLYAECNFLGATRTGSDTGHRPARCERR